MEEPRFKVGDRVTVTLNRVGDTRDGIVGKVEPYHKANTMGYQIRWEPAPTNLPDGYKPSIGGWHSERCLSLREVEK